MRERGFAVAGVWEIKIGKGKAEEKDVQQTIRKFGGKIDTYMTVHGEECLMQVEPMIAPVSKKAVLTTLETFRSRSPEQREQAHARSKEEDERKKTMTLKGVDWEACH